MFHSAWFLGYLKYSATRPVFTFKLPHQLLVISQVKLGLGHRIFSQLFNYIGPWLQERLKDSYFVYFNFNLSGCKPEWIFRDKNREIFGFRRCFPLTEKKVKKVSPAFCFRFIEKHPVNLYVGIF